MVTLTRLPAFTTQLTSPGIRYVNAGGLVHYQYWSGNTSGRGKTQHISWALFPLGYKHDGRRNLREGDLPHPPLSKTPLKQFLIHGGMSKALIATQIQAFLIARWRRTSFSEGGEKLPSDTCVMPFQCLFPAPTVQLTCSPSRCQASHILGTLRVCVCLSCPRTIDRVRRRIHNKSRCVVVADSLRQHRNNSRCSLKKIELSGVCACSRRVPELRGYHTGLFFRLHPTSNLRLQPVPPTLPITLATRVCFCLCLSSAPATMAEFAS